MQVTAPVSGVVSYAVDGYEQLDALLRSRKAPLTVPVIPRQLQRPDSLIEQSAPVYKLVTSDDWSIVFPLSENAGVQEYTRPGHSFM